MGGIELSKKPNSMNKIKNIALLTQLGFSMALPIVAGVYIGSRLDNYFNTAPLFLLVLLFIFSISSFVTLFKLSGVSKTKKRSDVNVNNDCSGGKDNCDGC